MVDLVEQADERGLAMSPSLPEGCKNYLIDIDGTVCEDVPNEQPERMEDAEVFPDVVFKHDHVGHRVVFGDADVTAEVTNRFRRIATSAEPAQRRHTRIVPAADPAAFDKSE